MIIKQVTDTDFINYKKPSMFIIFPHCSFKCDHENNRKVCQNSSLANLPNVSITVEDLVQFYESNPITEAVVCGGLEPLDSFEDLLSFISYFRYRSCDDIVIYTGYMEEEVIEKIQTLSLYENIIVKFGRFIPNCESHFDEILGVKLASPNQYAKYVGDII